MTVCHLGEHIASRLFNPEDGGSMSAIVTLLLLSSSFCEVCVFRMCHVDPFAHILRAKFVNGFEFSVLFKRVLFHLQHATLYCGQRSIHTYVIEMYRNLKLTLFLRLTLMQIINNSVSPSLRTHTVFITKTKQLKLLWKSSVFIVRIIQKA